VLSGLIESLEHQCDEKRPVCNHCVKQRRQCEFSTADRDSSETQDHPHSIPRTQNQNRTDSENSGAVSLAPSTPVTLFSSYTVAPPDAQPHVLSESILLDLALMRHYALTTSLSLAGGPAFTSIWQDLIPSEAESNPFLMHGLLAITALDLAHSHPARQQFYFVLAARHQDMAITLFRPTLNGITEENSSAVFAYSGVAAIIAFAMPQVSGVPPSDVVADLLEIFKLVRGVHAVINAAWGWIDRGSLAPLIRFERGMTIVPAPAEVVDALQVLEERNKLSTEDELVREVYSSVIKNLRSAFEHQRANVCNNVSRRAPVFSWPILVTSAYPIALARREPMALAILAHYGVIIHSIRDSWWFGTWGSWIVNAVSGALPEEWQPSIQWPKDKIAETN